jgi:hypothetical protein
LEKRRVTSTRICSTKDEREDQVNLSTIQGDRVWLEGTNLKIGYNKKITTKREGPFPILEVLGPVNYQLKLPEKWRMKNMFHASLLTPYNENEIHGPNYPRPPLEIIDGEEEWEIERIVGHKKNKELTVSRQMARI